MHRYLMALSTVAALAVLPAPVRAQDEGAPPEVSEDATEYADGAERMRALLEEIRVRTPQENPYLGSSMIQRIQRQLGQMPKNAPLDARWQMQETLGLLRLAGGDIDAALKHFTHAHRMIPQLPKEKQHERSIQILTRLGTAHLLRGERSNCVAGHNAESCILPLKGGGVHTNPEGAKLAIECFKQVLRKTEENSQPHLLARWLLNVASMATGEYPKGIPKRFRIAPSAFESSTDFPRFRQVAGEVGLDAMNLSGGSIVDDFDGDGDLDIFTSTWNPGERPLFFVNEGGSFEERGSEAGLDGLLGGLNLNQADYDNDGDLDVFVLRGAWLRGMGRHPNSLLRNNGDGTFTDVTFESGLGIEHYPTHCASWADYDLDGHLDLFIGSEAHEDTPFPCQLFRNQGDGTFKDVAAAAGVTNLRWVKGLAWGDIDNDRDPDLYVSNMKGDNRLYRNNGDGTFTDVAPQLDLTGPFESFPTWFWDYDNDGWLDLFVACYVEEVESVAADYLGLSPDVERPAIYRNDGQGGFANRGRDLGVQRVTATMGANFGDLDGDGWLDFFLGTGYPDYTALMPNLMFRGEGGNAFQDVTFAGGFGHLQKGHAISFADLDHDGDVDVFAQMGGAFLGDAFHNALWENPGFGRSWLALRLEGTTSNRCAIGTRIAATWTEGGVQRTLHRQVDSGGSFGANPLRQMLGLGHATTLDRLEIRWPASDSVQVFEQVPVGQFLHVVEGRDELTPLPYAAQPLR